MPCLSKCCNAQIIPMKTKDSAPDGHSWVTNGCIKCNNYCEIQYIEETPPVE